MTEVFDAGVEPRSGYPELALKLGGKDHRFRKLLENERCDAADDQSEKETEGQVERNVRRRGTVRLKCPIDDRHIVSTDAASDSYLLKR